jgi:hypothetical protein
MTAPSWYDPSYGNVSKKNEPTPPAATNTKPANTPAGSSRSNERTINGQTYVRQADGSYKLKEQ